MRPKVLLDPHWRRMDELFAADVLAALNSECDIIWGKDDPMPHDRYSVDVGRAEILITTKPVINAEVLETARNLKMVIEVEGAFPDTIDYALCAERGIEVLCCAPGFRQSVAEMGIAMALAGARGLVNEHEAMRAGTEHWLDDRNGRDFTLYGASVGFIGFGQIAQEMSRLLAPFRARLLGFDPWLPESVAEDHGLELASLDTVLGQSRCLFVTAVPTAENYHLLNAEKLALMPQGALLVLLSRAHLVDFEAMRHAVAVGRIRAAVDVFPSEPAGLDDPIRLEKNVILSPHRAAAVPGGRHLIGEMILSDIRNYVAGQSVRLLSRADPHRVALLAGVGDAAATEKMALERS